MEKTPSNAAEWNAAIIEQATKEGVKPEEIAALRITEAPAAKKEEEKTEAPVVLSQSFEVNGKKLTFSGKTNEEILQQAVAAYSAVTPAPVQQVEPPKKKTLSQDEMFKIGQDLMVGKPEAIKEYIQKSDVLDEYFKEKGIDVAKLNEATKKAINAEVVASWEAATTEWLKQPGNDYPGGQINKVLLGTQLANMNLGNKPSVESLNQAYAEMKKQDLVHRPAAKENNTVDTKKAAPGSSAFGKGAEVDTRKQNTQVPTLTRDQLAKMSPLQIQAWTNDLLAKGVNPDSVVIQ